MFVQLQGEMEFTGGTDVAVIEQELGALIKKGRRTGIFDLRRSIELLAR